LAPIGNGRGILPLGPDLVATLHVLLAYLIAQSNCVLCHSSCRRAHSGNRPCAYVSQMAAHSAYRSLPTGFKEASNVSVPGVPISRECLSEASDKLTKLRVAMSAFGGKADIAISRHWCPSSCPPSRCNPAQPASAV